MLEDSPRRLLILASKLGYQTRSFGKAAQKLGVEVLFATDRCHQLEDPWDAQPIAVHFEQPQQAAFPCRQPGSHSRGLFTGIFRRCRADSPPAPVAGSASHS